jgi:SAM-dependent methyltransferase
VTATAELVKPGWRCRSATIKDHGMNINEQLILPKQYARQINVIHGEDTPEDNEVWQLLVYEYAHYLQRRHQLTKILDLGCGAAHKTAAFFGAVLGEVHAVDWDTKIASQQFPTIQFRNADLDAGSIDLNSKFDLIICADVVEHMNNPFCLVETIKLHAMSETLIVISTRERSHDDEGPSINPAHAQEWEYHEFGVFLHRAGFKILDHFCVAPQGTFRFKRWLFRVLQACSFEVARRYFRSLLTHDIGAGSCQVVVCRVS